MLCGGPWAFLELRQHYSAFRIAQRLLVRVERIESLVTIDSRLTRGQYEQLYAVQAPELMVDAYARVAAQTTVRGGTTVARVTSRFGQTDGRSKALVRAIRATPLPDGFSLLVGGGTAGVVDYADTLYQEFPRAAVFVVVAIYGALFVMFRSVVLPFKAPLQDHPLHLGEQVGQIEGLVERVVRALRAGSRSTSRSRRR